MGIKDILNPNSKADEDVMYGDGTRSSSGNMSAATTAAQAAMHSTSQSNTGSGSHVQTSQSSTSNLASNMSPTSATSENQRPPVSASASIASIKSGVVGSDPHAFTAGDSSLSSAQHDEIARATYTARKYPLQDNTTELEDHTHGGYGHEFRGDPCEQPGAPKREGYHSTSGPHVVDTANILDPNVPGSYPTETRHNATTSAATGTTSGGSAATSGPVHDSTILNKLDPRVKQEEQTHSIESSGHHGVRDAAAVGGVGALGAGAYEARKHHDQGISAGSSGTYDAPISSQSQSVHPTSTIGRDSRTTDPLGGLDDQRAEPPHQHAHHGRDAAAFGLGTGAVGAGAYEAEKHHGQTKPETQTTNNEPHHNSSLLNKLDPRVKDHDNMTQTSTHDDRHLGRDATVVGGVGAAGIGAYELEKNRDTQPHSSQTGSYLASQAPLAAGQQSALPQRQTATTTTQQQPVGSQASKDSAHFGRDAAVVGGGAAAAGAGAYELDKHQRQEREKEVEKEIQAREKAQHKIEKEHEKELQHEAKQHEKIQHEAEKNHEKELKHHAKEQEKLQHKEQKEQEKLLAKEEKHHEKLLAKEEKKHEKEVAKADKEHEKEKKGGLLDKILHKDKSHDESVDKHEKQRHEAEAVAAADASEKEKKAGLLDRILHKDKSHDESHDKHKHEAETAAGTGAAGATADNLYGNDHKLHKEPPEHVKRELEQRSAGGHTPTELQTEGYGRDAGIGHDSTDPTTGLEGTRAPVAATDSSTTGQTAGKAVDPVTGLPINHGIGTATGGTDGTAQIHDAFTRQAGQSRP